MNELKKMMDLIMDINEAIKGHNWLEIQIDAACLYQNSERKRRGLKQTREKMWDFRVISEINKDEIVIAGYDRYSDGDRELYHIPLKCIDPKTREEEIDYLLDIDEHQEKEWKKKEKERKEREKQEALNRKNNDEWNEYLRLKRKYEK